VQGGADCVTVKVLVAIVTIAVLALAVVLAATLNLTVPFVEPLAPAVTVIQLALLVAVHPHPDVVVTVTVPVPPVPANAWFDGEMLNAQPARACVTVKLRPPMVRVAVRLDALLFTPTLKVTVPLPVPLDPLDTINQFALLVAVQAQPAGAVTPTLPAPPLPANSWFDDEVLTVQLAPG
jgi:hypothetical protein